MSQDTWDHAILTALLAFALSVGALALAAICLALLEQAAVTAQAVAAAAKPLAAAVPGGLGLTVAVRLKRGRRK